MIAILLGAVLGTGLVAAARGLWPPRPSLADSLAALGRPAQPAEFPEKEPAGLLARWGRRGVPVLRALGLPAASLRADLAVAERPVEVFLAAKAAAAAAGLLLPWAAAALVTAASGWPGWWIPASASVLLAVGFFFLPDGEIRQLARQRRTELRHTLSVVLDLAVIALAGGAGVQQALDDATSAPGGWAAGQLRGAVATAYVTRSSPWHHLAELGDRTGVVELRELAATVALAGSEGAKIRASLEAKAQAMRRRQLTDAEAAAQAATERMSLPIVLQFCGFLIFIGTPAISHVLAGL